VEITFFNVQLVRAVYCEIQNVITLISITLAGVVSFGNNIFTV